MKTMITPNGTTWSNGHLQGHVFDGIDFYEPLGILNLPEDCELRDEQDNRWFLGAFDDTSCVPSTLLNTSFKGRRCRIDGKSMPRLDGGIGTIRVKKIEWVH